MEPFIFAGVVLGFLNLRRMNLLKPDLKIETKIQNLKVVVFGGGSFGTALGYAVARNGHNVVILTRNEKVVSSINNDHMNDFILPNNITATSSAEEALKGVDFIIHAVPVQDSEKYLSNLAHLIPPKVPIICSSKGIHSDKLITMMDIIQLAMKRDHPAVFLSGPSFAKEILSDLPTAVVAACKDLKIAERVQALFTTESSFKVYVTDDVIGVEVGGALKNVYAIAAGVASGMGLGMNSKAALVTRGCLEMTKIALAMGARAETLSGLSGMGDLMLTCFGSLSRNQTVGIRLGKGEAIEDIKSSMTEVAEGVATTPAAAKLADKYGIDAPIIQCVNKVLNGTINCKEALLELMTIKVHRETSFILSHEHVRSSHPHLFHHHRHK